MSREPKRGKQEKGSDGAEKVIVAVKASKEFPKAALVWSLTHVVQPGDCITLLVVVPSQSSGRRLWVFPRFAGDCASGNKKSSGTCSDQKCDITDSCSQMIRQLHDVYDPNNINIKIKIVSGSPCGAVAAEAKKAQANWVVLDKQLKHEEKRCMEELQCNIVAMKRSQPKVLRLNLVGSQKKDLEEADPLPSKQDEMPGKQSKQKTESLNSIKAPVVTPTSSPELGTPFTATEAGTSSVSSSDPGTSPFFVSEVNGELKKEETIKENQELDDTNSDTDSENMSTSSASLRFQPWITELLLHQRSSQHTEERSERSHDKPQTSTTRALLEKFSKLERESGTEMSAYRTELDFSGNVREAIALSRNAPPGPPPLCSICQHKAPVFGKPPRWFSYAELELATGGFSQANFLAEGGFGSVHRGVLPDGQVIAVKQHKLASSQGDLEFCSEVEVLSCAQHRNVVMLIGFCIEDKRRLLVYEYICNGSLDSHLYGRQRETLEWSARQKIAVGAARGLRYLHEECRVGCIIHRDMRPNNILITHDFEPLVGDFGLARWQPDGDTGVETRVIGTFGYLAPEYAQSGQITEKADVYSFGVVLVELVTGRKAVDLNRPKGQQCLTEWARPLLEEYAVDELIDPRLGNCYSENEVHWMLHAASLCIRRDPHSRPRMSQVLRILEGDMVMDTNYLSTPSYDGGSQSGRIWGEHQQRQHHYSGPLSDDSLEAFSGKLSLEKYRSSSSYWDKARRTAFEEDDM
ncbi:inactive protein kinase [Senna tora]|uniref:Inactive protein kinase n=1 Tax=Senna tora TaxID=362788 RepID=A0A835CLJ5_9FABA|nr:inactive protein kinase [Senna tora]